MTKQLTITKSACTTKMLGITQTLGIKKTLGITKTLSKLAFVLGIVSLCSACTTVRFNERERLSEADMQFDSTVLKAELESHVYSSREGSSGTFATGGGGGCGCY